MDYDETAAASGLVRGLVEPGIGGSSTPARLLRAFRSSSVTPARFSYRYCCVTPGRAAQRRRPARRLQRRRSYLRSFAPAGDGLSLCKVAGATVVVAHQLRRGPVSGFADREHCSGARSRAFGRRLDRSASVRR
jgi:hypothetical protein